MGFDWVASLFNRAVLDSIVGFLALIITNLLLELLIGVNCIFWLLNSPYGQYIFWILLTASFLSGHLVDKMAFLVLDHTLFARHFQSRRSTFDLPEWCQSMVEKKISHSLTVAPSKSRDLVDDTKADWITAFFLMKARPEVIYKRADLIANFQFVSNLLLILIFALLVIPAYIYFRVAYYIYSMVSAVVLLVFIIAYWRFSLASLARIHTLENLVVFGFLIDERSQETEQLITNPKSLKRHLNIQNPFDIRRMRRRINAK